MTAKKCQYIILKLQKDDDFWQAVIFCHALSKYLIKSHNFTKFVTSSIWYCALRALRALLCSKRSKSHLVNTKQRNVSFVLDVLFEALDNPSLNFSNVTEVNNTS